MRKKSHIALAQYLLQQDCGQEMMKHKKAFYLGSILPDLNPKMFAAPHEYATSYEGFQVQVRRLTEGWAVYHNPRAFWRRLGIVLHYLADYFTFPHNTTYGGSLADHCAYEGDMKHRLREYVRTKEAADLFRHYKCEKKRLASVEELFVYIEEAHSRYLDSIHTVESDCRWIVEMSTVVLLSVVFLMEQNAGISGLGFGLWAA